MNILALGDYHGKILNNLAKIVSKNKIDLVISIGDYSPFTHRKLFFKYCYAQEVNRGLWEFIGKKKYKEGVIKDIKATEKILKELNKLPVPVLTVIGNVDIYNKSDVHDADQGKYKIENDWAWADQDFFSPMIKKYTNIKRIDYRPFKFKNLVFLGMNGSSFPGKPKSKSFRKSKKKLDSLFKKFRKESKEGKIMFISHNIAHNTKLDQINNKGHKLARHEHYGSKLARRIVDQYHPRIHIGGHIHEGRGIQKLRKTLMINPGSIHDHEFSIISIPENKREKIKVKLIR